MSEEQKQKLEEIRRKKRETKLERKNLAGLKPVIPARPEERGLSKEEKHLHDDFIDESKSKHA